MYQISEESKCGSKLEVWENGVSVAKFSTYKAARDFVQDMMTLDEDDWFGEE
jgi:hypothetical protein